MKPDPTNPAQRVAFGTSGHRGSSFDGSFNEDHISRSAPRSANTARAQHIDGPLFIGIDTHALSAPAFETALEVLTANGVETVDSRGTPNTRRHRRFRTRYCVHNRGRTTRTRRRHRRDAVAQSARQRRHQVQPAERRAGGVRRHALDPGPAPTRCSRPGSNAVRRIPFERARRAEHARARLPGGLRRRSRQRHRLRCRSAVRYPHGRRPVGRRRRALLGAHRRTLRDRPRRRQRRGRPAVRVHDTRLGRARSASIRRRVTRCND